MIFPASTLQIFADGLDHPEGVMVGIDGAVYAGGEAGQVYRIEVESKKVEQIASTGGFCLGLAQNKKGEIFICDCKKRALIRVDLSGRTEIVANEFEGRGFRTPNFAVFDRSGNLYFSDSGDWTEVNGCIYRISADGKLGVFHAGPFHFANGLSLNADETFLYVAESTLHRVIRIPILADGSAGTFEVFAEQLNRVPDGIGFDALGRLYVTCYASDMLYRCGVDGSHEVFCHDPDAFMLNRPTNVAFLGANLLIANLGGEHLSVLPIDATGMPLFHQKN